MSPRPKGQKKAEASRMTVNIWDVCRRSEKPLTVEEIADQLRGRGLDMNADALMFYKKKELAKLDDVLAKQFEDAWSNEAPPAEVIDRAWSLFVAHCVQVSCQAQALTVTTAEGVDPRSRHAERRYSANLDSPPMVYQYFVTTEQRLVPYDPEQRDQLNDGHTAGMEFLRRKAELGARNPKPAEARELLDLAETAIRAKV